MVDPRSVPVLSTAYADLAEGLRELAADLHTLQAPAVAVGQPRRSTVRDAVEVTARSVGAVVLQACLLGAVLLLGFHVWMALFPPLRPAT